MNGKSDGLIPAVPYPFCALVQNTDIMFPEKGVDVSAIARQLTDEHVLIPPAHAAKSCSENDHSKGFTSPYTWSTTAVCYILEKQE